MTIAAAAMTAAAFATPLQGGLDAYERGDYVSAEAIFRAAAELGNAEAQNLLGEMHAMGKGVVPNSERALYWYKLSASQSFGPALANIGVYYYNGIYVMQNYAIAHMYFSLAAARGVELAVIQRNVVEEKMTPDQLEKAQRLAREWRPN